MLLQAVTGDEVWIEKGTYIPTGTGIGVCFKLKDNVSVYGGFARTETLLSQRPTNTNTTIININRVIYILPNILLCG